MGSTSYLRFDGGLTWPATGQVKQHRDAFEHMRRIGYPAYWLRPEDVSMRTPGVDPSAIPDEGAIFNPGEGWVELPPLIDDLALKTTDRGGAILTGVGQSQILLENDRVTGVRTGTGETVHVDVAVLATGPAVPATVAELRLTVPDARGVALLVRTPPFGTSLRAVLNTPRVSLRPTASGSLVMDTDRSAEEIVRRDESCRLQRQRRDARPHRRRAPRRGDRLWRAQFAARAVPRQPVSDTRVVVGRTLSPADAGP